MWENRLFACFIWSTCAYAPHQPPQQLHDKLALSSTHKHHIRPMLILAIMIYMCKAVYNSIVGGGREKRQYAHNDAMILKMELPPQNVACKASWFHTLMAMNTLNTARFCCILSNLSVLCNLGLKCLSLIVRLKRSNVSEWFFEQECSHCVPTNTPLYNFWRRSMGRWLSACLIQGAFG